MTISKGDKDAQTIDICQTSWQSNLHGEMLLKIVKCDVAHKVWLSN